MDIEQSQGVSEASSNDENMGEQNESVDFAGFNLEGKMSIRDAAQALGVTEQVIIEKLDLPHDIPQNSPLRDLWDEYGYTMPKLKERLKR